MNRIILIGNGFDLAHGLYTKYSHFIDWFWEEQTKEINKTNVFGKVWNARGNNEENEHQRYRNNDFFDVKFSKAGIENYDVKKEEGQKSEYQSEQKANPKNLGKEFVSETEEKSAIDPKESSKQLPKFDSAQDLKNNVVYKNKFLELIDKKRKIQNWVDIEELYFEVLTNCKNRYKQSENVYEIYTVKQLNSDFRDIKNEFEKFIRTRNHAISDDNIDSRCKKFREELEEEVGVVGKIKNLIYKKEDKIDKILLLNFNYSDTIHKLYGNINGITPTIISIHGQVSDGDNNPMIFGYGDEFSEDSVEIEKLNDNDFLENVKSIKYVETGNYSKYLQFIKSDPYDVFVFGHSCGNSDRTLLKELFGNPYCKKIKCFYYKISEKEDDFNKTVDNIYRKFDNDNKADFRLKILQKDKITGAVPQFKANENNNPFYKGPKKESENSDVESKAQLQEKRNIAETKQEQSCLDIYNMVKVEFDKNSNAYKLIEDKVTSKKNLGKDFYIGKYPVTQKEWNDTMKNNPSWFTKDGGGKEAVKNLNDTGKLPIESVSWNDCVKFCNKLSEKYGLKKYYNINESDVTFDVTFNPDANGFRLPTEAEWEYAAKHCRLDGTETTEYAGTNNESELKDYAWYGKNSEDRTHEVGTAAKAKELKIHDMSGNVWEWTFGWFDRYSNADQINPQGAPLGSHITLRGGGWESSAEKEYSTRVAYRAANVPASRSNRRGLRLVISSVTLSDGLSAAAGSVSSPNRPPTADNQVEKAISTAVAAIDSTTDGYYEISTPAQLDAIRSNLSGRYKLTANISLASYHNWIPIGSQDKPFTGKIDGNGYKITDLRIDRRNEELVGLFSSVKGGVINNLALENVSVVGRSGVGGIAGFITDRTLIANSYSTGNVSAFGRISGGLVGQAVKSTIINSYSRANINFDSISVDNESDPGPSGGLVGSMVDSTVANSYSAGTVIAINGAGGIVGLMSNGSTIINCYNTGSVDAITGPAGGIAGRMPGGTISNCYSTGSINMQFPTIAPSGGIVGDIVGTSAEMPLTTVKNCAAITPALNASYSAGRIVGNVVGLHNFAVQNNFALEAMSANGGSESFRSEADARFYGVSKSDALFKKQSTYSGEAVGGSAGGLGWKFGKTYEAPWKMPAAGGYPIFYWQ